MTLNRSVKVSRQMLVLTCLSALLFVPSAEATELGVSTTGESRSLQGDVIDEPTCDLQVFQDAYAYELDRGLILQGVLCADKIQQLLQTRFGPPSAWEVFNTVCKGTCRDYTTRYNRVKTYENVTLCECAVVNTGQQSKCPRPVTAMLCVATSKCYAEQVYQATTCDVAACGRWSTNEASYRSARTLCGVSYDGAVASGLHSGVLLLTVFSLALLTNQ